MVNVVRSGGRQPGEGQPVTLTHTQTKRERLWAQILIACGAYLCRKGKIGDYRLNSDIVRTGWRLPEEVPGAQTNVRKVKRLKEQS